MSTLNKNVGWTESEGNPTMPVSGLFDGSEKLIIFLSFVPFSQKNFPNKICSVLTILHADRRAHGCLTRNEKVHALIPCRLHLSTRLDAEGDGETKLKRCALSPGLDTLDFGWDFWN